MTSRSKRRIALVLADDKPVVRTGLRTLLTESGEIEVVGEAQDGFEARRLVAELHPQILLLDLKMPSPRPAELEGWVREKECKPEMGKPERTRTTGASAGRMRRAQ